MSGDKRALIAGGGIGGLTAAIAFARTNIPSLILERGAFADETGAGIQLGANASRRLRELGALDSVAAAAYRPEAVWLFDARSGEKLTSVPLGSAYEARYGAPYLCLHRADLHQALYRTCMGLSPISLTTNVTADTVSDDGSAVSVRSTEGLSFPGSFLVGADGLWSRIRQSVAPEAALAFTRRTAARALIPTEKLGAPFDAGTVTLWLGKHAHLVTYPVRGGELLNVVLGFEGGEPKSGWNRDWNTQRDDLLALTEGWAAAPRDLVECIETWRRWSLFRLRKMPRWSRGNTVLLGDAAHPILPFLAQGAALAIEDAAHLADALTQYSADRQKAFAAYEATRRPRALKVMAQSARMGTIYHFGGMRRAVRNAMLRNRNPETALDQFDWLYGA
ncbi:FAD-dependent monooxygenase [Methyloligella sp. 2.7D]|uniref:FAD-dependent monooxygenase n=1 Tax=unclassified Methyloligella TaxID=2625955 RepID=UPI00157C51B4|nr:FAD-dependent monooxygenase [Methyloligella sp. GL2]QKP77297.1 FAD-dependent monooxygenase [Methyloligella sp. GL2]